jgi:uncharacterized membrane protein YozB (DUF420 family)
MSVDDLPALNAALNATSGVLLFAGWRAIEAKRIELHRNLMLAAFGVSTAFLVSYVYYHLHHGATPFPGTGLARTGYLVLLFTHVVLAAAVVPFAVVTLVRGLRRQDEKHRRVAKITFPMWGYVSVTGVLVYWILYHLYAA